MDLLPHEVGSLANRQVLSEASLQILNRGLLEAREARVEHKFCHCDEVLGVLADSKVALDDFLLKKSERWSFW